MFQPLVSAIDPNPINVEYISLKNYNGEHVDFYYGNSLEDNNEKVVEELTKEINPKFEVHPLLLKFKTLVKRLTVPLLVKYSKYFESWDPTYTHFVKVDDSYKPEGWKVRFPVYVQGWKDARILLTSTQSPDPLKDNVYEIRIGASGNSLTTISRKMEGAVMKKVYEQNILSPKKVVKLVVEVTQDGHINVYTSYNPWIPLISVFDKTPLDINYVGFASNSRVQFFYDVDETTILSLPVIGAFHSIYEIADNVKHPLLTGIDYPVGIADLYFKKYAKEYYTIPEQPNTYAHYISLGDIDDIRPQGYLLRLPIYVQGSQMAHILLSNKEEPTEHDNAYEIVLGDRDNSRLVIRKRINGAVLADEFWPHILSQYRRKKFVFEVQVDGVIRLFSEDDPYKPMIAAYDPQPVQLHYLSFKSWKPEKMIFNYGNLGMDTETEEMEKIKTELLTSEYKSLTVHPLLMTWKQVQPKLTLKLLLKNGQYYETWLNDYMNFVPLEERHKPAGYIMRFPLYVQGEHTAKFLLSTKEMPNLETDNTYEIRKLKKIMGNNIVKY